MTYINRKKKDGRKGEVRQYDRSILHWGEIDGEWRFEPDFVKSSHHGLIVVTIRNPEDASLRGFVGIPDGHPLVEDDLEELDVMTGGFVIEPNLSEWHGENGLCRNPADPNEYLWDESGRRTRWVGFDHAGSIVEIRRVLEDCVNLAGQISSYDPSSTDEDVDIDELIASFEWWD